MAEAQNQHRATQSPEHESRGQLLGAVVFPRLDHLITMLRGTGTLTLYEPVARALVAAEARRLSPALVGSAARALVAEAARRLSPGSRSDKKTEPRDWSEPLSPGGTPTNHETNEVAHRTHTASVQISSPLTEISSRSLR